MQAQPAPQVNQKPTGLQVALDATADNQTDLAVEVSRTQLGHAQNLQGKAALLCGQLEYETVL
jgi:hypothetical protein